jgi:hypothetical protein
MNKWASENEDVEILLHLKNLTTDLFGIAAFSYDFHSLESGFSVCDPHSAL